MCEKSSEFIPKEELLLLTQNGNLGDYKFCEVVHFFLLEKGTTKAMNYFTHINFSAKYTEKLDVQKITEKPLSVSNIYQLGIIKYTMNITDFIETYCNAGINNVWEYKDIEIEFDGVFFSQKKFVKAVDPTGGKFYLSIPIEWELYGSNFCGNYYITELYSTKAKLNEILSTFFINKIQTIIKLYQKNIGYKFNFIGLRDRIGNVVCKFNSEVITSTPKRLGYQRGIEYEFSRNDQENRNYILQIMQTHDGMIYENSVISNYDLKNVFVEPNQCVTSITLIDDSTGLTVFAEDFDYNFYSDYFAVITLTSNIFQSCAPRVLYVGGERKEIPLTNLQMAGEISFFYEQQNANNRLQQIYESNLAAHRYLCPYYKDEHEKALFDIAEIISGAELSWDLEEICVIDPYLTATEIIYPFLHCSKLNIRIKCLCAYQSLHSYSETRETYNANSYDKFKNAAVTKLSEALSENEDLQLEYRSIVEGHGIRFHDRYIILKFGINKCRVWSLGASVNSLGKSHSIMQIVRSPEIISNLFEDLWNQTNIPHCVIFKN